MRTIGYHLNLSALTGFFLFSVFGSNLLTNESYVLHTTSASTEMKIEFIIGKIKPPWKRCLIKSAQNKSLLLKVELIFQPIR